MDAIGGECSTYGGNEEVFCQRFWSENIHERIISEWILKKVVYWIHLAQDMDQWRALVNAVMNFRVS
jgi:hypothetical protein